jgi:hypothetical protein
MSIATRAGMNARPEVVLTTDQDRCMACLVANGTVQVPRNMDVMPDRVFSVAHHGVSTALPPLALSPVRVYDRRRHSSMVIWAPVEVMS